MTTSPLRPRRPRAAATRRVLLYRMRAHPVLFAGTVGDPVPTDEFAMSLWDDLMAPASAT